ncbi:MAG: site-2 protease family protein [Candidatus Promineifilaceae bacterium]
MRETKEYASATLEDVAALRQQMGDIFVVDSYTLDRPQKGAVLFRGQFMVDLTENFDRLRSRFETQGFTPMVRKQDGDIVIIALPIVFEPTKSNWLINLGLFIATVLSTLFIGAASELGALEVQRQMTASDLLLGLPYCLSLLLILGAHELGHYFAARYHKVPVTLPYFIPLPIPPIGTLGAFIQLKAPVKNRRALFDVGAAGPLAGLVFAIPILLYGLATSPIEALPPGSYYLEGNSVLYALAKFLMKGQFYPTATHDVFLSALAWAGWVGLLVTGLNLLPVGQLDGGHVSYVLFGDKARTFFWPVIIGLVALVLLTGTLTWVLWIGLLFVFGRRHAEPLDGVTELDPKRKALAIFTLLLFFLVFVPVPLQIVGG